MIEGREKKLQKLLLISIPNPYPHPEIILIKILLSWLKKLLLQTILLLNLKKIIQI
jgi:hypothetical protein